MGSYVVRPAGNPGCANDQLGHKRRHCPGRQPPIDTNGRRLEFHASEIYRGGAVRHHFISPAQIFSQAVTGSSGDNLRVLYRRPVMEFRDSLPHLVHLVNDTGINPPTVLELMTLQKISDIMSVFQKVVNLNVFHIFGQFGGFTIIHHFFGKHLREVTQDR